MKNLHEGVVHVYTHQGRISVIVDLRCATDFASRTIQFSAVAHEVALQACAMGCVDLLGQERVRGTTYSEARTIGELLSALSSALGEPVELRRVVRVARGEPEQTVRAGDRRAWFGVTLIPGEDGLTLVEVQGAGLLTQGANRDDALEMAREALALIVGCEPGDVALSVADC